jgi:quinol monooxygenase YgiN
MTNQGKDAIIGILYHVVANEGKRPKLFDFLEQDRKESLERERGTLRFDIFQDPDHTDAFYVYEAYEDQAAFEEHKTHDPYLQWDSNEFKKEVVKSHKDLSPPAS